MEIVRATTLPVTSAATGHMRPFPLAHKFVCNNLHDVAHASPSCRIPWTEFSCQFLSNGIFPSPLSRSSLVPRAIGLVNMGDFWHERVVRIWVSEHGADGK